MGRQPVLLIIDDDVDVVSGVRMVMEPEGWAVHSAPNGVLGVEKALELRPDLVVLDILMPQRDGLSTYGDLRRDEQLGSIPIIILTSVGEKLGFSLSDEDLAVHYGRGPEAFLEKPVDPKRLVDTVRSVTGRKA
jgi:two-component system alkaline phosphatase synthesis response regulator PhoP